MLELFYGRMRAVQELNGQPQHQNIVNYIYIYESIMSIKDRLGENKTREV